MLYWCSKEILLGEKILSMYAVTFQRKIHIRFLSAVMDLENDHINSKVAVWTIKDAVSKKRESFSHSTPAPSLLAVLSFYCVKHLAVIVFRLNYLYFNIHVTFGGKFCRISVKNLRCRPLNRDATLWYQWDKK